MKKFAVGFLFSNDHDRVVLIEKRKPTWQLGKFNGVGGKIEDETPLEAMIREFQEETGQFVPDWKCFCILRDPAESKVVIYFFRAFDTLSLLDVVTVETEHIATVIPQQLPPYIMPNLRWLVPLALDINLVAPITIHDLEIEPRAAKT